MPLGTLVSLIINSRNLTKENKLIVIALKQRQILFNLGTAHFQHDTYTEYNCILHTTFTQNMCDLNKRSQIFMTIRSDYIVKHELHSCMQTKAGNGIWLNSVLTLL